MSDKCYNPKTYAQQKNSYKTAKNKYEKSSGSATITATALHNQEEKETDKTKQAQIKQTYKKR